MKEGQAQTELLQRYILGELPEVEQQQLEERYFTEPELVQELNAVRAELLDAWANQTSPLPQREQLERQLQKLPALRQQAEFALSLRDLYKALPEAVPTSQPAVQPALLTSFFSRWFLVLTATPTRPVWVAVGLLAILGVWYATAQRKQAEAPRELTAQIASSPAAAAAATPERAPTLAPARSTGSPVPHVAPGTKAIATFFLTPGLTRDELKVPEIFIPAAAQTVRLQLETENDTNRVFTAVLQAAEGGKLWEKNGLQRQSVQGIPLVSLSLPAKLLQPQTYRLLLLPAGDAQPATTYYFKVTD